MHSNHDRSSGFQYYNDQVPEQYNMQLSHACPMEVAAYPLQETCGCSLKRAK